MEGMEIAKAAAALGAAFVMGIGAIGPALGQGFVGGKACENIGKYPESANKIQTTMMIAMGLVETSAIFAFLIAIILIRTYGS
jgi:F-type H+-transporting ATPase subunit c